MRIFTEEEVKRVVKIDEESVKIVEDGFTSLMTKEVQMPPIMRIDVPESNGEVDVKAAYIPGFDQFAIKLSSGFFNNEKLGLPSASGMMILLSSQTGDPVAIFLDNGYLTHVRTAAAGAISAKYLAKEKVNTAGVIGTGSQARYQMLALQQVRSFKRLLVYGRNKQKLTALVKQLEADLQIEVIACETPKRVVVQSEVVVTTTPSKSPIIQAEWLHPGLHITAMGSDAEHKQEIDAKVFQRMDRVVCDVVTQCKRLGELHHAFDQGALTEGSPITEIGQLTSGQKQGRINDEEMTICDLTGTGVQDTAIALVALDKLVKAGAGLLIED